MTSSERGSGTSSIHRGIGRHDKGASQSCVPVHRDNRPSQISEGVELVQDLGSQKKKGAVCSAGYRFERIRSVRDAVLARSPLVIALTDRQVGRRLTGDRQAEERHCPDSQRKPNLPWGKRRAEYRGGCQIPSPRNTDTPRQKHTTQLAIESLTRQETGEGSLNPTETREKYGGPTRWRNPPVSSPFWWSKLKSQMGTGCATRTSGGNERTDLGALQQRCHPCRALFASLLMSGERRRRARTTSSAEPFHRVIIERGRQLSLPARSAVMGGK